MNDKLRKTTGSTTSRMHVDWRKLPNAPAAGTTLCELSELLQNEIRELRFHAAASSEPVFQLILHRQGDDVNAYVNRCPHHWLPMNHGTGKFLMWSTHEVMCTHHSAVFNLVEQGVCIMGPCQGSNLIRVPVETINGLVRIEAQEAPGYKQPGNH